MLRISLLTAPTGHTATLRLAGQVRGPWVEELRRACEPILAQGERLLLDLTEVSFIDSDGVDLCRTLRNRKVAIMHCSPFVGEQLKGANL